MGDGSRAPDTSGADMDERGRESDIEGTPTIGSSDDSSGTDFDDVESDDPPETPSPSDSPDQPDTDPDSGDDEESPESESGGDSQQSRGGGAGGTVQAQLGNPESPDTRDFTDQMHISDTDAAEVESMDLSTERFASSDEAPTPAQISRQLFADGVQSRTVRAGLDGHRAQSPSDDSRTFGTWQTYDPGDVSQTGALGEHTETTGRTESHMTVSRLDASDSRAATTAFVTDYGYEVAKEPYPPEPRHAQSQMAVSAGLDAMGVRSPSHAFDTQTETVAVESVSRPNYDAVGLESGDDRLETYGSRIDADQARDTLAANVLMGNGDLSPDNLQIGEDGSVITFDYDYTSDFDSTADAEASYRGMIDSGLEELREYAGDDFDVTTSEVLDRATEIANEMEGTGAVDRVKNAIEPIDDYFNEEYGTVGEVSSMVQGPRDSPTRISDRFENHVETFAHEYRNRDPSQFQ